MACGAVAAGAWFGKFLPVTVKFLRGKWFVIEMTRCPTGAVIICWLPDRASGRPRCLCERPCREGSQRQHVMTTTVAMREARR